MKRMLVLGATSKIAVATLYEFIKQEQWHFILCGRNLKALDELSSGLSAAGASCEVKYFDTSMDASSQAHLFNECIGKVSTAQDAAEYNAATDNAVEDQGQKTATAQKNADAESCLDAVFCSVGYLGDQKKAEVEPDECELIIRSNFNGLLPILSMAGNYFKERALGSVMVVSSVAGERGRCSNYCYGASKAAMTAFLSGMRCSLLPHNVHVMTIKPGYVATRMVAHKKLPPYITASTTTVAKDIVKGYERRSSVVYTMWLWRYIMAVVRLIPESIFKHLNMF